MGDSLIEETGPPSVTTQPSSQTVQAGQSVAFSAEATGSPAPSVQWQVSTDGGTSYTAITGATSTSYSFTTSAGQSGNRYEAVFTNGVGSPATTNAATLTVTSPPSVTTQPTSVSVLAGQSATFSAAASGNPTPTVQWQVSTDAGTTYATITGATSPTYSFTSSGGQNGDLFRAVFTDGVGSPATTNSATLTVISPPSITSFSPASGPVGTVVTIHGTNLSTATIVTINGVAMTITKETATKIKVTVPLGATTGNIKVITSGGKVKPATVFTVT